jgi:O-antigen ligase
LNNTVVATVLCAGILCAVAFGAGGGLYLGSMTAVEIALTLGAGVVVAAVVLAAAHPRMRLMQSRTAVDATSRPLYGAWTAALLLVFAALSAASIVWSVEPNASWEDSGRLLAYGGVFAAAVALARIAPQRWSAILAGVTVAAVVVSAYALLAKILPGQLDPNETYARLQQPYGYWIATGLTAAMGAIGCLWLGARRDGHGALRALAYPAMGLELTTVMLTYSRGPLAALAIGLVFWFSAVPLRLRGATVLLTAIAGAAAPVAFDFSQHALTSEGVALGSRASAGHQLGVLVVAMLLALLFVGVAIGFFTARQAPKRKARQLAGAALLGALVAAVLAVGGALAVSQRGLTGTISHDFNALTNPNAKTPENTPDRLTAIASVRARYWKEALEIFSANPVLGAGAGGYATARLRYRDEPLNVRQAHGYVVQTLAELGLVGLAVTLALFVAWLVAAGRATHPWGRRWRRWQWRRHRVPYTPERIGLLSALAIVVVFGAHSLVDWTWYVPGDACVALLCAGWLAGRGPLQSPAQGDGPPRQSRAPDLGGLGRLRLAVAAAVIALALLAAWTEWQPERSAQTSERALTVLSSNPVAARADARAAISEDPISAQALGALAAVQQHDGEAPAAEATLQRAVAMQPSNPQTWTALGEHDLSLGDYTAAVNELRAAVYLNPEIVAPEPTIIYSPELLSVRNDYLEALRASRF